MDRARSKKIRNIRVIATNIFMCLSVIAIVFVLMMIAMGFTFTESGKLEQAGLVQLASNPSDATVQIDGEKQFSHTEFSKMLSGGSHDIVVSKPGYGTWSNNVKIDGGLLTRVDWIRLFPKKASSNKIKTFKQLRFAFFSANRKKLIAAEENSNQLLSIDIQNDKLKTTKLDLNECLSTTADKAVAGNISIIAWNNNNSRFIAKWTNNKKTSWHLVDLEHSENSINLTKKFNLNFDSILISNDSASKLWALENGNLRIIDANSLTISSAIASDIIKIAHNRDVASFVNQENGEYQLSTYRDGEKGATVITKLPKITEKSTIKLAMGTYWNENWLSYSVDQHINILSGKYPSYGRDKADSLSTIYEKQLDYTPQFLSINANQRIIAYAGDQYLTSFDVETKESYNTELKAAITNINWLDSYLVWQNVDNTIIVRDFDGSNRRKIISNIDNPLPVIVSENNRWLYYFSVAEEETDTNTGSAAPSDADPTVAPETVYHYNLNRIQL